MSKLLTGIAYKTNFKGLFVIRLHIPCAFFRDLSPSSAGKRQVPGVAVTSVIFFFSFDVFQSPHLCCVFPGHRRDSHSIGGRREKKWMKGYQRAISINKVNSMKVLTFKNNTVRNHILTVTQVWSVCCSLWNFFTFFFLFNLVIFFLSPFARCLHYQVVWSQCRSGSV